MKALGVILVILGLVGLVVGGISYTKREEVIDVGPIEASVDTKEHIPIPPVAGAVALAAGVVLLMQTRRRVA